MKTGDIVQHRYSKRSGYVGLLLSWWEYPGDEERLDEIYWKVLMNGKIKDIKERLLVKVK